MFKRLYRLVLLILLASFSPLVLAAESPVATFISVADLHFSPFTSCSKAHKPCAIIIKLQKADASAWPAIFEKQGEKNISNVYHDTDYPLLKMAFLNLKNVSASVHPHFVLVLGDLLAHDFRKRYIHYSGDKTLKGYEQFTKKTIQFIAHEFAQTFSNIDVYPAVGNNDSYTGDYSVIPRGHFFRDSAAIWAPLIKNKMNQASFRKDFPIGGYYKVRISNNANQSILMLNSVLFSSHVHSKAAIAAAHAQLHWMSNQLHQAKVEHQRLWLADHIPVGIDIFATIKAKFSKIQQFWQPEYTRQFEEKLNEFPDLITAILSAHIHADTFQIITLKKLAEIPVYFTPSISPIYGNNPGFKVFYYDTKSLKLKNFDTYYYPLDQPETAHKWLKE